MKKIFILTAIIFISLSGFSQMGGGHGGTGQGGSGQGGSGECGSGQGGDGETGSGEHGDMGQGGMGQHGEGMSHYGMDHFLGGMGIYNPETVETLSGTVLVVNQTGPEDQMGSLTKTGPGTVKSFHHGGATLLDLEMADGSVITVFAGPSWFLEEQEFSIEPNDTITVTGSVLQLETPLGTMYSSEIMLAAEITKGQQVLTLRDEFGFPVWIGDGICLQNGTQTFTGSCLYDIENEEELSGTLTQLSLETYMAGFGPEVTLVLTTGAGENVNVWLAPYWFLARQEFELYEGLWLRLTGVFVENQTGESVFIVRLLEIDGQVYELRDENGSPNWRMGH